MLKKRECDWDLSIIYFAFLEFSLLWWLRVALVTWTHAVGTGSYYSITSLKVKLHADRSSLFCGLSGKTCRGGDINPRYCLLDLVNFLSSLVKEMPFLLSSRAAWTCSLSLRINFPAPFHLLWAWNTHSWSERILWDGLDVDDFLFAGSFVTSSKRT